MVWTLENPPKYNKSHSLAKGMNYLLGNHFPGVQQNAEHFFSLYYYLLANLDTPVSKLRTQITHKGKPIFSVNELKQIVDVLVKQKNTKLAKYTILRGGAVQAPISVEADPSRSGFWDKVIHKLALPVTSRIPPSWDGVSWYFHILYHIEQMDFIGPMISTALDTVTLSLPVIADMANEIASKTVSLAPVPYASFVGDGIGYMISLIFISFAVLLNASRKHFGSGFKASLEAVPVFGDILSEAAQSVEIGAQRYLNNRKKLLKSVEKVSPAAEDVLDYYTPDVEVHTEKAPEVSMNLVKRNVIDYVAEETGLDKATAALSDPSTIVSAAVGEAAAAATANITNKAAAAATAAAAVNVKSRAKGGNRTLRKRRNVLLPSRKYR